MKESNAQDKRRYLRYEVLDYALLTHDADSEAIGAVVVDIGLGGLQLRTKGSVPVGVRCSLKIGRGEAVPLFIRGEVRHCGAIDDSDLYASGFRFLPENHTERMSIAEYVHDVFQRQCERLIV